MNGILTDIDFNLNRPIINTQDASLLGIQTKQFVNNTPVTTDGNRGSLYQNVFITAKEAVSKYLPESIGQFFGANSPTVEIPDVSKVKTAEKVKTDLIMMFNERELFSLLDFVDSKLYEILPNCVFTSISFDEDPDSGDAVYPNMSIERVKFAKSTSVTVQTNTTADVAQASTIQSNKGKQNPTTTTSDSGYDPELESQWHEAVSASTSGG